MNQMARGGDDPTPPEGGTTRVPQTSQSPGPAPSLPPNLQGDRRTADTATMCQTVAETRLEPGTFQRSFSLLKFIASRI